MPNLNFRKMSDITAKEAEALLKFRENLADLKLDSEKNSNNYLIRWLRARDLNLKKAEDLLRASLKWREDNKIDSILEWKAPEEYKKYLSPVELCGYSKDGYPVLIVPLRMTDTSKLFGFDTDEYLLVCAQNMEKLLKYGQKYSTPDNPIFSCISIYDLEGVNIQDYMTKQSMAITKIASKFHNENYPEVMHKAYFLFAPRLFTVAFTMLKPFIPKQTLSKFKIFGSNKEDWTPELLSLIDADQLPVRMGGTDTEFEKTAFQEFKMRSRNNSILNGGGKLIDGFVYENVETVPAGKSSTLYYKIEEPNSLLKWNFTTQDYDIGFSIWFDETEIVKHRRVDPHKDQTHEGDIICVRPGEYSVIFENGYSRWRSKTVFYRVEIVPPTTIEVN